MSTSIISSSNANGATTTSSAFVYAIDDIVRATVVNPAGGVITPCQVTLQLSADGGVTYRAIDSRRAGMEDSGTSSLVFNLTAYSRQAAWTHARLVFSGNTASSQLGVTISAIGDGGTWGAVSTVPATGSTITQHLGGIVVPSGTSGTITLDLSTSDYFAPAALTGATTFAFSNPPAAGNRQVFFIRVIPGGFALTWPGTVKWPGGTAPTPSPTAGKVDLFGFLWDGTSYLGTITGQNF